MGDIYLMGLEANAANYAPLTPLVFLDWSADVYPASWPSCTAGGGSPGRRRRAVPAACLGVVRAGRGLWGYAVVLANTPVVVAHFGVPMAGAVLNTSTPGWSPGSPHPCHARPGY